MNNWKKLLCSLTVVCLMLPVTSILAAAEKPAGPVNLVPVREIAAKNGAEVLWQQQTGQITIRKSELTIVVKVGDQQAIVNGQVIPLDNPVRLTKGVTYMDEGFLTETLKASPEDRFISLLSEGDGKEAAKYVHTSVSGVLSPTLLSQLWGALEAQNGKITSEAVAKHTVNNNVHRNVTYTFKTELTQINITVRMNDDGLVDDLYIAPATPDEYQKPSYDDPSAYTEQAITVGQGIWLYQEH
ncbi:copper amine oxidase N-terminal domain-containing protein [Paenibacillus amylolyticus]|nr:copper amine oxidase N-terminal domain-containing protein [Paenibacillus amylolyticus]WFR62540.1 copper amine oxidase N-terminal domain-containing protein [Paenibacillus amylolyticus]